jgi:hypothetical protein
MTRRLMFALALSAAIWLTPTEPAAANGCGLAPLPPLPPIGCRAMRPTCICDALGNCHWEYECVR